MHDSITLISQNKKYSCLTSNEHDLAYVLSPSAPSSLKWGAGPAAKVLAVERSQMGQY
jgi:hypothetical protein